MTGLNVTIYTSVDVEMLNLGTFDELLVSESIAMVAGTTSVRLDNVTFQVISDFEVGGVTPRDFGPVETESVRRRIEDAAAAEYFLGSNWPLYCYATMGNGTAHIINLYGTPEQKEKYG